MKISPLAQGTGVPAASDVGNPGRTASPEKMQRAKAIASGQEVPETTIDPNSGKVENFNTPLKRIQMKTQMSTNRHEIAPDLQEIIEESPKTDINEQVDAVAETKPLNPEIAAVIRQKRALQVKERELVQREEALKSQTAVANPDEYISKADLLANPLKVFDSGVTYDSLTEAILNGNQGSISPQQIDALVEKKLNERLEREFGTRDQQQEQQVLAEIAREAKETVYENEEFEAIRMAKETNHPDFANGKDPVTKLIHRVYKDSGKLMSVQEAAQIVEAQVLDEAMPFTQLKKVQSRLTPAEAQAAQQPAPQRPNTKIMRTLTNRDNTSQVLDRRARAIAAMNGTLKRG